MLRSLEDLLRNRFNISLAEVEHQDKWQRAMLAITQVGTQKDIIDRALAKIVDFIRESNQVELIDYQVELF